jgi:hypothetical protein
MFSFWKSSRSGSNQAKRSKTRQNRAPLSFQPLEPRAMMAANLTASFTSGILKIEGTERADQIYVRESNGIVGSFVSVDKIKINDGGKSVSSIAAYRINKIEVRGLGGDDTIDLHRSSYDAVSISSVVWGGAGNDKIYGGTAADTLHGNAGSDTIYGMGGNDLLTGGTAGVDGATVAERDKLFGGDGFDRYTDGFNFNDPTYDAVYVDDVQQGASPTCATLASIASATKQGARLENNIKVLGGNRYEVNLLGKGKQIVSFNGGFNDNDPELRDGNPDFWVILLHRARLQAYGVDVSKQYTEAQWDAFNTKSGNKLFNAGQALKDFTNWTASYTSIGSANAQKMADALGRGDYIVASSFDSAKSKGANSLGIVGGHAYSVMAVYKESNTWKVRLYNPWGSDSSGGKTIDSAAGGTAKDDGFITLTWSQFANSSNFRGYYTA